MTDTAEVYVGKQVTVEIWNAADSAKVYDAYVAQEVTLEPAQAIEGIDGLGSDEIQVWAPGLKTFTGTIREPFITEDQLNRTAPFQATLTQYTLHLVWATGEADETITIKLSGCIFPSASLASPKNAPIYIDTTYRAKSVTVGTT